MGDCCEDNRFVLIERAKQDFIENTNLSDAELAVLDRMCFRMWQMGLLEKYEESPEKKVIDKEYYKELIDMLIDELETSKNYHLGITGLDSDAEIVRKEREGDTALIRGIDRTIKYVKSQME